MDRNYKIPLTVGVDVCVCGQDCKSVEAYKK